MEKYLFALFIFMLALMLAVINHKFKKSRSDTEELINEKEKRLLKLYSGLEEIIGSTEEYIEEAKKEIENNRELCQSIAGKTALALEGVGKSDSSEPAKPEKPSENLAGTGYEQTLQKVMQLKSAGADEETIARQLMLSKGEVSLILKLSGHAAN